MLTQKLIETKNRDPIVGIFEFWNSLAEQEMKAMELGASKNYFREYEAGLLPLVF
jgi:hypothetical protein